MCIRDRSRLLLLLLLGCSGNASYPDTLRSAASARGLYIGAATNAGDLTNSSEPEYTMIEQRQFSITTAENSCKVGLIHPEPATFDWTGCDKVFDSAASANQSVRGHNLCWHKQNPGWLNSSLSKDQLANALGGHIDAVVGRYGERAYAWDVVNEAVSDGGSGVPVLKADFDPWLPKLPDFIDRAFVAARKAGGKNVKLFYNDYGAETMCAKSDRVYELVAGMLKRGIPIDGVGFQSHLSIGFKSQLSSMERNLKRFAALGLEIHITELDVRACNDSTRCDTQALGTQAEIYAELVQICLSIPECKVLEMWGFTDRHTWTRHFQNPTGKDEMPLPFDVDYKPKPAFSSMLTILNQHKPVGYTTQVSTCRNAVPLSGLIKVSSVAGCEAKCTADPACVAVDTDGASCYTKSKCDAAAGSCVGWCSYRKSADTEP
eukprot:TRINITY_DN19120_c0_g1_i1.p1 TRINITY_DN19120_c0_g1~~TRINITY_DN19120_c0_g1_i1.p1  ORF type:complete len:433 (+),score=79.03 TRINITY_DN19120_c0_g1_i1:137-1435(+)